MACKDGMVVKKKDLDQSAVRGLSDQIYFQTYPLQLLYERLNSLFEKSHRKDFAIDYNELNLLASSAFAILGNIRSLLDGTTFIAAAIEE